MQLDDLKTQWRKEMNIASRADGASFKSIINQANKYDRRMRSTVFIEIFACFGIMLIAGLGLFLKDDIGWMRQLGYFTMIAVGIFIAVVVSKFRKVSIRDDWTLSSRLASETQKLERQKKLLGSTAFWYLTPCALCVVLITLGSRFDNTGSYWPDMKSWIFYCVYACLLIFAYFYHQWEVKRKINPLLQQLKSLQRELSD